ncbi:hypothetical protein [Acidovorax sp. Leaf160]|uniref:hypothetical protein n=1 Tax=Acidovorax sp. Leaf160 TaxID=1736280 RepID=UPI0006F37887|nr:hypothetical protein [Acidovorax sp. Leaf160]KQR55652.1 hypothetical protein ASF94_04435 [Acidovorax sp. Leaf160]
MNSTPNTMTPGQLLELFASPNDLRRQLRKPWREGDHVFAANGHWVVRVPLAEVDRPDLIPDPTGMPVGARFALADWSQLKPMGLLEHAICDTCDGAGRVFQKTCESCKGQGEFTHFGQQYECQLCDASGYAQHIGTAAHPTDAQCDCCRGTGFELNGLVMHITPFRGAWFQKAYLARLSRLPGIEFGVKPTRPYDPEVVGTFRFDGGDGLLMPCRAPHESEA